VGFACEMIGVGSKKSFTSNHPFAIVANYQIIDANALFNIVVETDESASSSMVKSTAISCSACSRTIFLADQMFTQKYTIQTLGQQTLHSGRFYLGCLRVWSLSLAQLNH
jgi:hypothetical protein